MPLCKDDSMLGHNISQKNKLGLIEAIKAIFF